MLNGLDFTNPVCDSASAAGTCDQFHRIVFPSTPCNVSGAQLVLSAHFLCSNGEEASKCGYVSYNEGGIYRLGGMAISYDA